MVESDGIWNRAKLEMHYIMYSGTSTIYCVNWSNTADCGLSEFFLGFLCNCLCCFITVRTLSLLFCICSAHIWFRSYAHHFTKVQSYETWFLFAWLLACENSCLTSGSFQTPRESLSRVVWSCPMWGGCFRRLHDYVKQSKTRVFKGKEKLVPNPKEEVVVYLLGFSCVINDETKLFMVLTSIE